MPSVTKRGESKIVPFIKEGKCTSLSYGPEVILCIYVENATTLANITCTVELEED